MKAIRVREFGGPDVLRIEEVPTPQPSGNQVLVRIGAAGVNPVETYVRSGSYAALPPLPYTPGKDAAGVIEAVGAEVRALNFGQRIYTSNTLTGAYAEFALCDAKDVHALPDSVSFAQGAAVNTPYATAYRALFQRAQARAGETVLVHGASGGVGTAAVQLARAAGMTVFGTAGSDRGLALARESGATHVFNHHAADYLAQITAATNGRGVNVIIEMLANQNLGKDLTILAKGGRVVVVGSRGPVEINPRDAMQRDAAVLGMILSNASAEERAQIYNGIGKGLADGTLRPVVGKELPLADAAQAHESVMQAGAYGKIVLVM
jgi:NADPH2:quinone reductase